LSEMMRTFIENRRTIQVLNGTLAVHGRTTDGLGSTAQ
jgi:hypothetical protein